MSLCENILIMAEKKALHKLSENQPPYPRRQWDCECGFRLVLIKGYNQDYRSDDYKKLTLPKGRCMKCNGVITV
jgi:hypothetical protein